ncbi:MFS transporter [Ideonella sp. 4Y11]|uniref:MFS transporter n=1 Tax=Ideonella aquatica TaxID=2824119 RepID=A0A940YG84_9BURK|nr:MFS transporter [Ideonella aquatica]MBQ0959570.1 MFS transporter [Ideonella aquatica]
MTVTDTAGAAPPRLRDLPDFRRLLAARAAATTANQMLMVALGWQMYELTRSAWQLGLVGLVQFVPALLLTLPAGHLVDQHDRRHTLLASLALQAVVAALMSVGSAAGWLGPAGIFAVSALLGAARALQMPSLQALLPSLVPPTALPRAVAAGGAVLQASIVGGPALGGLVYAAGQEAGAAWVYGLALLLLVLAGGAVLRLTPQGRPACVGAEPGALTAGLRFILAHPVLLGAMGLDLLAVLLGGATALLPMFARDILGTGPEGLGLLRAAPAMGALACGLWLARHPLQRRAGRRLLQSVAVYGLATLGFALAGSWPLAMLALAVAGAADMVSVVIRQSLVQMETPDAMRGRVAAVNSVFIGASNQLGEFESGATAAWLGPVGSVLLGGTGTLLAVVLWPRLFPALWQRDKL